MCYSFRTMKELLLGIIYLGIATILCIPIIVTDTMFFPFITGKNFTFRITVEIIFAAWIILALLDARYRPKFSWLFTGLSAFMVVMFFANLFGEYAPKSFWSNFERMDGYVTLVHFYLLFVVLAHTLRDKQMWTYLFGATVAVATYMAFDGWTKFLELEGARRIDGRLGNAAYMAIYMLFHAFFTIWLFIQTRNVWLRTVLGLVLVLFVYVLLLTGTRGTFIALMGGISLIGVYTILFSRTYPVLRKIAFGVLATVVMFVGGIYAFQNTAFVSENKSLNRIASINLQKDLEVRMDIWGMAYDGAMERPVLGWGQGNFNYIFNAKYHPDLYRAELWYDRAHNIILDWLVAGGVIGLLTYLSIFAALGYYLLWRPFFHHDKANNDKYFTVPERAVLIGLVAAYFVHNLVVFDNIVSYIFFAIVLALIHARIAESLPSVEDFELDPRITTNIIAPVMLLVIGSAVYFVNIPSMQASGNIIDALTSKTISGRLASFDSAIEKDSFAYQEIVEQLSQQAMQIAGNPNIPNEEKREFLGRANQEIQNLITIKPNDARVHVFAAGFYRNVGAMEQAVTEINRARELSPTKQSIIMEQAIIAYQMQEFEKMHEYFKEAYELQKEYDLARIFYASSFMYIGQPEKVNEIITDEYFVQFSRNDFALQSVDRFEQNDLAIKMLEVRIGEKPQNQQNYTSLAFVYHRMGEMDMAVATLRRAAEAIQSPSFTKTAECFIANIEAGEEPGKDCQ